MKKAKATTVIPTKSRNADTIKLKQEKIIQATRILFSAKGFRATSMRSISAKSGINISSLYSYIKNKDDILHLFYNQLFKKWSDTFKFLTHDHDTAEDTLATFKIFLKNGFNIVHELTLEIRTMYSESRHLSPKALKIVMSEENKLTQYIETIIKCGVKQGIFKVPDTHMAANIVQYLLVFHAMRSWNFKKGRSYNYYVQTTIDFILKGLGVQDEN